MYIHISLYFILFVRVRNGMRAPHRPEKETEKGNASKELIARCLCLRLAGLTMITGIVISVCSAVGDSDFECKRCSMQAQPQIAPEPPARACGAAGAKEKQNKKTTERGNKEATERGETGKTLHLLTSSAAVKTLEQTNIQNKLHVQTTTCRRGSSGGLDPPEVPKLPRCNESWHNQANG